MKKIILVTFLSGLLFTTLCINSCKLLDVEKDITFTIDIPVDENDASFDDYDILDAVAESSVIDDYKDLLKSIKVKKVEYTVFGFSGGNDQQINTATLDVMDTNGNGAVTLGTVVNENLMALTTMTKELTVNDAGVDRLSELILNDPHTAQFHYYGTANYGPMNFTARFIITVTMTANPL